MPEDTGERSETAYREKGTTRFLIGVMGIHRKGFTLNTRK